MKASKATYITIHQAMSSPKEKVHVMMETTPSPFQVNEALTDSGSSKRERNPREDRVSVLSSLSMLLTSVKQLALKNWTSWISITCLGQLCGGCNGTP